MEFISPDISLYSQKHTSSESKLLQQINRETHLEVLKPRMLSGHLQGRFLSMISKMIRPIKILEIGTFTGYSTICLAEGLSENGKIYTLDNNEEQKSRVDNYFSNSIYKDKIVAILGNALDTIPTLNESWDLVFIDADKQNYSNYYDLILPNLKSNSYILADNVLWSGKVLDNASDKDTQAIMFFNQKVQNDTRVENLLLPFRDGLMILRVL